MKTVYLVKDVTTDSVTPCKKLSSVMELLFGDKDVIKPGSLNANIRRKGSYEYENFIVTRSELK